MRAMLFFVALALAVSTANAEPVSLLDGKLQFDSTDAFVADKKPASEKQAIAHFEARDSNAWGMVLRGTHGLQPSDLPGYLTKKVAEFTKGLAWLPKLNWLKKEVVTIGGRQWVDLRYIAPRANAKNPRDGLLYTRFLTTSYKGQLLEITFTSNTDENPLVKDKIDRTMDSIRLEE
jgi:hypothetical protein